MAKAAARAPPPGKDSTVGDYGKAVRDSSRHGDDALASEGLDLRRRCIGLEGAVNTTASSVPLKHEPRVEGGGAAAKRRGRAGSVRSAAGGVGTPPLAAGMGLEVQGGYRAVCGRSNAREPYAQPLQWLPREGRQHQPTHSVASRCFRPVLQCCVALGPYHPFFHFPFLDPEELPVPRGYPYRERDF